MISDLKEELIPVSMDIILNSGNAREKISMSLNEAKRFNFEEADRLMHEAENYIVSAHRVQTKIIQAEANDVLYPYSALFSHAQDTLMTINSELRMSKQLLDVLRLISKKGEV